MIPQPQVQLTNVCSTIYNNTLYTFSEQAFQSLQISEGAQWSMLKMGVPVSGGVCVQATPRNDSTPSALYIVGGIANSTTSYSGLQRYVFSSGKWETITPLTPVTQDRLYHNAVYLNTSASILVYAGTQDGTSSPSSQTFTINTAPPYDVLSYQSQGATPGVSPLLMQWSESKAVMMGGGSANNKIYVFEPSKSWVDLGSTLANPLRESSAVKAVVINGNDGSKNLYTFDMTTSPNTVNRTIIVDGDGNVVPVASAVVSRSVNGQLVESEAWERSEMQRRAELTEANWPTYNATFAPEATRRNFSMAKDQSGLVVVSGGSKQDVLCMFRARKNVWINATTVFYSKAVSSQGLGDPLPSSTGIAGSGSTAPSSSSAGTAVADLSSLDDARSRVATMKILGGVLGGVAGIAVLLFALLFFLRWRHNRHAHQEAGHQRRASGLSADPDKEALDFGEKGPKTSFGHSQQESQGSFSSMAILMGKVHPHLTRNRHSGASDSSDAFTNKYNKVISSPIPRETRSTAAVGLDDFADDKTMNGSFAPTPPPSNPLPPTPQPRLKASLGTKGGNSRRSSGWDKYWSGGSLGILGFGNKRSSEARSDRSSGSEYSSPVGRETLAGRPTMPPPLVLPHPPSRMSLSRVPSGSPTISHGNNTFPFGESMRGQIETTAPRGHNYKDSLSSVTTYETREAFLSGVPDSSPNELQGWGSMDDRYYTSSPNQDQQAGVYHNSALYSESEYGTNVGPESRYANNNGYTQQIQNQRGPGTANLDMALSPSYHSNSHGQDVSWINLNTGSNRI